MFTVDGIKFTDREYLNGIIVEVFSEDAYRVEQTVPMDGYVIDLGANIGAFTLRCAVQRRCHVCAVEPGPRVSHALYENVQLNGVEDLVEVWPVGVVDDVTSTLTFYEHRTYHTSSTFMVSDDERDQYEERLVDGVTLQQVFDRCLARFPRIDVLKMDIECMEQKLFTDENAALFKQCGSILLEWHFYDGHIYATYLSALGFDVELTGCGDPPPKYDPTFARGMLYARKRTKRTTVMKPPKLSVLLCTVRPDHGYLNRPDLHTLTTVCDDLAAQTYKNFELIIVDGIWEHRPGYVTDSYNFDIKHVPPRDTIWTRNKKVAICTYRNTGLSWARGELVVNLDDCCRLPPMYLEVFAKAYFEHQVCAAMTWPSRNDSRLPGRVLRPGQVFGFGSYAMSAALTLNGYDEAYDGAQGLEDADWSTRLFHIGMPMVLVDIPGFDILPQTGHDSRAIDASPLARCCNASWQTQRVWRQVARANDPRLWEGVQGREALERLVGPCRYLITTRGPDVNLDTGDIDDTAVSYTCKHHGLACPYIDRGFVLQRTELQEQFLKEPPVFDLKKARAENGL